MHALQRLVCGAVTNEQRMQRAVRRKLARDLKLAWAWAEEIDALEPGSESRELKLLSYLRWASEQFSRACSAHAVRARRAKRASTCHPSLV